MEEVCVVCIAYVEAQHTNMKNMENFFILILFLSLYNKLTY